jgi:uncharacterized protein YjiS (DUF1127 family)
MDNCSHLDNRLASRGDFKPILQTAGRAAAAMLHAFVAGWSQRRLERRSRHALQQLDPHTLRDLGFHRSEILSVAAELFGAAEPTRARLQSMRRLPC